MDEKSTLDGDNMVVEPGLCFLSTSVGDRVFRPSVLAISYYPYFIFLQFAWMVEGVILLYLK